MKVLYVFPGRDYSVLDKFLSDKEVRIGYSLKKELFSQSVNERIKYLRKIAKKRRPGISEPALKRTVGQWNSFFDSSLKYAIFPAVGRKKFYLVELDPKVKYDPNSDMFHVRKFKMIGDINLKEPYINNKGVSQVDSEKIHGLNQMIKNYENKNTNYTEKDLITEEPDLEGNEGKLKDQIIRHLKKERDKNFVRKYRKKYKHIVSCPACSLNSKDKYEMKDPNSIREIHHIVPLKHREGEYIITEKDVSFLCPNCHRVIHRMMSENDLHTITIEDFKNKLRK